MRYPSVDILRMLAIFVMVFIHFGENLSGYTSPAAGLGAPLFVFLSGVSYVLWVKGQQASGKSDEEISKVSVRRGLFVFGVGFAFNILVWLPEGTFNWDVLTFIGVALLLLNLARRIPLSISVLAASLALILSPIFRLMVDYKSFWLNPYFDYDMTLSDVLVGFLVAGYFPIFPWIAFSLAGLVTATLMFPESSDGDDPPPSPWQMVYCGIAFTAVSWIGLFSRPYLPDAFSKSLLGGWTVFPPTLEYVLGMLGMTLILLGLLHQYVDLHPRAARFQRFLNVAKSFSQYSFTNYVLHHLVHLWPLWLYALATGNEPTYYWMKAMPLSYSLSLAVLYLVTAYFLLRWLGPNRRIGIEAWMRWLCD